jgi:hypothetical protein
MDLLNLQFGVFFNDLFNNVLYFNKPKLLKVINPTPIFVSAMDKTQFIKELLNIKVEDCSYKINIEEINKLSVKKFLYKSPYLFYGYEKQFVFSQLEPLNINLKLEDFVLILQKKANPEIVNILDFTRMNILKTQYVQDLFSLLDILYAQYCLECHNINMTLLKENPESIAYFDLRKEHYILNIDNILKSNSAKEIIYDFMPRIKNQVFLDEFRDRTITNYFNFKKQIKIQHFTIEEYMTNISNTRLPKS